jgi:TPP-dependent pyruvate/acetoin dehydrogenase alpha subunit
MYSKDFLKSLYRTVHTIRLFELEGIKLYRQGFIRGYFHPYLGEEAIAAGVCGALRKNDYILSTHRGHGHCIAKGASIDQMMAELLGKETGYCKGLGGSMHIADLSKGNLGANGVVGANIPMAVGVALGIRIRKEERVVVAFSSDGATCNGTFGESLSLAVMWDLPLILVIENNQYAVSTPINEVSRSEDLYPRAAGYGAEAYKVDGQDVLKVYEAMLKAIDICKKNQGPVVIEALTFRHAGHHVNDPGKYMPEDKLEYYRKHDPVPICLEYMKKSGISAEEISEIENQVDQEMKKAIELAMNSPEPDLERFLSEVEI